MCRSGELRAHGVLTILRSTNGKEQLSKLAILADFREESETISVASGLIFFPVVREEMRLHSKIITVATFLVRLTPLIFIAAAALSIPFFGLALRLIIERAVDGESSLLIASSTHAP